MQKYLEINLSHITLKAILTISNQACGIILFSHGSGSGRLSPRNQFVAEVLQKEHFATLLVDLLTESEDQDYQNRFNIELLTNRLIQLVKWVKNQAQIKHLPIGLFGASTGAAAALKCAANMPNDIKTIVSRGGRPDLAAEVLNNIKSPTLLIVGENDPDVINLNKQSYLSLTCIKKLEIVPGATHLFEEPGTLEKVSLLAAKWFKDYILTN